MSGEPTDAAESSAPGGDPPIAAASPSRRWPTWIPSILLLVAGLVVFFPAIRAPLHLDDYFQTSMIEGTYPAPRSPFDLYNFCGDADREILLERGLLPWWSDPHLTIRFLRPLSSVLLFADHRLLGNHALVSHIHSFMWWCAAVFAARALYRRALSTRAALLATFIFALAPCHVMPLGWLANREALVSLTFGVLGLTALLRYREHGRLLHVARAALLFGLSLLGGEYALSFGGYALALALTPAVAYLAVRSKLNYGADGSGVYYDPLRHPLVFLEHAPRRVITLLAESWLTFDPDILDSRTPVWVLALVAVLGVGLFFWPVRGTLARLDGERRDLARWLLLGSFLSLAPVLAVTPSPRLLGASVLGVAAIVALVLERAWFPTVLEPRSSPVELTGLVALLLGFAHFVHNPGAAHMTSRNFRADALRMAQSAATLSSRVPDPAHSEVFMMRGFGTSFILPFTLDAKGTPPARWRLLGLNAHVLALRIDARTLDVVAPPQSPVFPIGEGNLFRGESAPAARGDTFRVAGMRATIVEVGKLGPTRVRYEFDAPLEAPNRIWVTEDFDGVHDATPPAPGFGKPFDPSVASREKVPSPE